MERIILFLEDPKILERVQGTLTGDYQVVPAASGNDLAEPWDLAIVDAAALERLRDSLKARKQVEDPVRFPVLLAARTDEWRRVAEERQSPVDEIMHVPVAPRELRLRVENLLLARRLSREV